MIYTKDGVRCRVLVVRIGDADRIHLCRWDDTAQCWQIIEGAGVEIPRNRPDLSRPEVVLALPILGVSVTTYPVRADGTVRMRDGRILTGLTPGNFVNVPRFPGLRAVHFGPHDLMVVCDDAGNGWMPVDTTEGWRRRLVP